MRGERQGFFLRHFFLAHFSFLAALGFLVNEMAWKILARIFIEKRVLCFLLRAAAEIYRSECLCVAAALLF
jgi:hypothetical protein